MKPLNIAICEDTHSEVENLLALLYKCKISTNCTVFTSGKALLHAYKPQTFDLLLMDIYMGGITGI